MDKLRNIACGIALRMAMSGIDSIQFGNLKTFAIDNRYVPEGFSADRFTACLMQILLSDLPDAG